MTRQGDMSVIYDFAVPVSADATINKRVAVGIDVVYRAARVEPRSASWAASPISSGRTIAPRRWLLAQAAQMMLKFSFEKNEAWAPWRRTDDTVRLKLTRRDARVVPAAAARHSD